MFPIRDHNPSEQTPYVVYALIAANLLGFALSGGVAGNNEAMVVAFHEWALIPVRVSQGQDYATFATSMFLHGGWMHLLGNMLFLWIFGNNLEDTMGHGRFALFYLAAGIGAGIVHVVAAPWSPVPTIGASGAIAGVMGGYLLLFPRARVDVLLILVIFFRVITIPAWMMLGIWLGFQLLGSLDSDPNAGGVAYWAHTGGFLVGLVLTVPVWIRRGGVAYWGRNHGQPPHPKAAYKLVKSGIPRVPRR
jgi:membrane associated rhomboid family serine protease